MNQETENAMKFVGYEYKEVTVEKGQESFYMDCYENFGWHVDRNIEMSNHAGQTVVHLKRDKKIGNKAELTRLQQHFESCANDIRRLEGAKTSGAAMWAISVAVLGTAFMAGSTFAAVHEPPMIWLCILLAIPGLTGWIVPYFLYRYAEAKKGEKLQPLIDEKYEEIYKICEKGHLLQS